MSNPLAQAQDHPPGSDRRLYARQPIPSLAYVELDEGNGGIVLNVSEGGLSVQAVTSLMDDVLPGVRFQLSESEGWIQANTRITWTGQSRKLAGLEFIDLPDDARNRIKAWLVRDTVSPEAPFEADATSRENETPGAAPDSDEVTASPTPAAEPAGAAENQGLDASTTVEIGIPAPSATVLEAPSPSAADVLRPIPGQGHEIEAGPSGQSADAKPLIAENLIANRWAAATVLLLLAIGSLAAGWAAGQGALGTFLARFHTMASQNAGDDRKTVPNFTGPVARVSEIEVVNASSQRWTIPFNGPLNSPGSGVRRQAYEDTSSQARKPQTGFRTWILSPPQQTRAATGDSGVAKEDPPVLAEAPASTESVLTQSGAINTHALAGPPSLRMPEPPAPTGVVKQGQVIRRVDPVYPSIARDQHEEGTVRLNVTIGADGIVRGIAVLGGPRLLLGAAESAVRQWRYTPTTLDGKPIEFQREVDLTFHLSTLSN